ncbi:MAG: hypothetical protein KIT33_10450 [Candidatus Kapabacteria bacterium]|nr:hypothetical protein [Ignavibacteriota bacterium]MCW5885379.1 hypothetical protein [Candidatus Kapabacteria bacterium]
MTEKISPVSHLWDRYGIIEDCIYEIDGVVNVIIGKENQIIGEFDALSIIQQIMECSNPMMHPNYSYEYRLAESYIYSFAWNIVGTFKYSDYSAELVINLVESIQNL